MADTPRLAVSNIAWEPEENEAVVEVLRGEGVAGVELAPTKWREQPYDASATDVAAYRRFWEDRGLRVVSLQSLLFGRPDLQLFGSAAARSALVDHMRRVIDFGSALGAHALVFGSPRNRQRGSLAMGEATAIAVEVFRELGEYAAPRGVAVCIEANPQQYGCDFVTTTAEAVALCERVNHPGIRINADLGGIALAGEDAFQAIDSAKAFIAHVHASEPHLVGLGARADHSAATRALEAFGYTGWVSIEMRALGAEGGNVGAVLKAIQLAKRAYAL